MNFHCRMISICQNVFTIFINYKKIMVLSDTFTHTSVIIFYIITLTVSPNNKGCGYLSSCATDYLP